MERGVLERWGQLARANLFETYIELAAAAKGTVVERNRPFTWVKGDSAVSFCNFCALFDAEESEVEAIAAELLAYGEKNSSFWVFATDFCRPANLKSALSLAGFQTRQTLKLMIWQGGSKAGHDPAIEAAATIERLSVTKFMTDIFFSRSSASAKATVMESTTFSPHRVFAWNDRSGIVAAVMTSSTDGVLGLYNLCVRSDRRSRGLGRNAVDFVKSMAAGENKALVLQCNANLEDWYLEQGFETIGLVDAYSAPCRDWGPLT